METTLGKTEDRLVLRPRRNNLPGYFLSASMKRRLLNIGPLALLLVFPVFSNAQNVTFNGKVTDENGEPLSGAAVFVPRLGKGANVDATGKFEFKIAVPASDSLRVIAAYSGGYAQQEQWVQVRGRKTIELNFQLAPLVVDETIITGKIEKPRDRAAVSITTLSAEDVNKLAANDVTEVLRVVPGYANNGQISLRGSSGYTYGAGSRVVTLLDNLPLMTPNLQATDFEFLPTENIARIEVVKGASSVIYGSGAMGGTINVVTKEPTDEPFTSIRSGVFFGDSPRNDSADFDGRSAFVDHFHHFYHARKIGEYVSLTAQVDFVDRSGYYKDVYSKQRRALLSSRWNPKRVPGLSVKLSTQAFVEDGATTVLWSDYPEEALIPFGTFTATSIQRKFYLDPAVSYATPNGKNRFQYLSRVYLSSDAFTSLTGEFNSTYHDFHYTRYLGNKRTWGTVVAGGTYFLNWMTGGNREFGQGRSHEVSGYVQMEAKPIERLSITAGFRFQYERMAGDTSTVKDDRGDGTNIAFPTMAEPIARAAINFRAAPKTYVRASVGQAVRSPSMAERFIFADLSPIFILPNPEIQLEQGYTMEVGVRQLFESRNGRWRGSIDAAAFRMDFRNMVEFYLTTEGTLEQGAPAFQVQNVPDALIPGAELETDVQYMAKDWGFHLKGGVTFIEPIDRNGSEAMNGLDSLPVIEAEIGQALLNPGSLPPGFEFTPDNPRTLKYRSRWMLRYVLDLSYKNFTFTTVARFDSKIENVDKLFLIDALFKGTLEYWQRYGDKPLTTIDFIFGWRIPSKKTGKAHSASVVVNNAFNAQNSYQPGLLDRQRSYGVQVRIVL